MRRRVKTDSKGVPRRAKKPLFLEHLHPQQTLTVVWNRKGETFCTACSFSVGHTFFQAVP